MIPFVEFRLSSLSTSLCAKRPKLSAMPIATKAFRINAEKIASVFLVFRRIPRVRNAANWFLKI
jgi:hypothetical protein